jgi:pyruvate,water dikinase
MIYDQCWGGRVKNIPTSFTDQHRFALTDDQILELSTWAEKIAEHYDRPMDIEWALDGENENLYILQARPETVQSRREISVIKKARLIVQEDEELEVIVRGQPVGEGIVSGKAIVLKNSHDVGNFSPGDIIVAKETDPDWVPLMKEAGGLITDSGGRTSHAAIVSRELGIPAVIGTGNGTGSFSYGQEVTLCCEEGFGVVYRGIHPFEEETVDISNLAKPRVPLMLNMANPEMAMHWWKLPAAGIGLARMEFIITNHVKVHPMAVACMNDEEPPEFSSQIERLSSHYDSPAKYFIDTLSMGIATIAASVYPRPVIVRFSDFKTNEYANLIGGRSYEPVEANPMLGFRGASRYYDPAYRPGFELECAAVKRAREELGFDNITVMIPFCRTVEEADKVLAVMAENGLGRGENNLEVFVMAEIPSNIILADEFADRFDGFSIGSNDLTQLVLGVDRDSEKLTAVFDERNPAIKSMITSLIETAHRKGRKVGICGQAPSDYPDFARFLLDAGIDSISLTPDRFVTTCQHLS